MDLATEPTLKHAPLRNTTASVRVLPSPSRSAKQRTTAVRKAVFEGLPSVVRELLQCYPLTPRALGKVIKDAAISAPVAVLQALVEAPFDRDEALSGLHFASVRNRPEALALLVPFFHDDKLAELFTSNLGHYHHRTATSDKGLTAARLLALHVPLAGLAALPSSDVALLPHARRRLEEADLRETLAPLPTQTALLRPRM